MFKTQELPGGFAPWVPPDPLPNFVHPNIISWIRPWLKAPLPLLLAICLWRYCHQTYVLVITYPTPLPLA